ncbi:hypothetical protein RF11_09755 [Thelohanellus kitauei]|uniref:Uncharacterized protein n=1 Tax=Thelohanellus kitauei TaxID=669202 RepID=A0A0C2INA2_THEKT|nr:hypothetical protein RF11_09755 [Thelohanellus kitauei]
MEVLRNLRRKIKRYTEDIHFMRRRLKETTLWLNHTYALIKDLGANIHKNSKKILKAMSEGRAHNIHHFKDKMQHDEELMSLYISDVQRYHRYISEDRERINRYRRHIKKLSRQRQNLLSQIVAGIK